jgi:hypothetical protein
MNNLFNNKRVLGISALTFLMVGFCFLGVLQPVQAAAIPVTVVGPDGVSHVINDITILTATTGAGGYKNQGGTAYPGTYQGVSIVTLCNAAGVTLTSGQNVTVHTTGGGEKDSNFTYQQAVEGTNLYPQYKTYTSAGVEQAPPSPVTLIVAYQFANGTALPGSGATRLMIVGPDGYLFDGQGFNGATTVTVANLTSIPEFTSSLILVGFCALAVVSIVALRKRFKTQP